MKTAFRPFIGLTAAAALLLVIALGFGAVMPAEAQSPVWRAEYYNNANLAGSPVVVRNEPNIAFNWSTGAPDPALPGDNFSVRFATDVFLQPGTYRFAALADDNVRITFNFGFQPIIDTFATGQVGQTVFADVTVPAAGTYHIQVDYRELTLSAYVYVAFANLATNPGGPVFAAPTPPPSPVLVNNGSWVAEYFNNNSLSGSPVVVQTEVLPNHNWGGGAPLPGLPDDNFSVRWTSTQNIPAGNYTVTARADDGVRVILNGVTVINQFGPATGQTYTANVNLPGGNTQIVVEYVEYGGVAFIEYALSTQPAVVVQPTPPVPSSGVNAVVLAFRLNVRSQPDPVNGAVVTRVSQNQVFPVLGRNADASWFQINANGVVGWVSGRFISLNPNNVGLIPIVGSGQVAPPPTATPVPQTGGILVTATPFSVRVRQGPGTQFPILATLPANQQALLIGRNATNTWWQVNYNGIIGWVSAQYAQLPAGANPNAVPVTG